MNNRISDTIKKFNMLSDGDTVLLGVSGGADSMLMLDYFVKNKDKLNINIKVAHIEHGIRGKASVDDSMFVKEYCDKSGVAFHMLTIDAVNEAKAAKQSVEEYSRNRRYEFFNSIDCDKIATAHNLTDNIETIIYRFARGTGLKGICGIPAVRDKIIRPLIELTSDEIRQYCIYNNISFRIDSTNTDNKYTRNKIRNEILPLLSQINFDYEHRIFDLICDINEDNSFITDFSDNAYQNSLDDNRLLIEKLKELDISVLKRVINKYFADNKMPLDRLHLCKVAELIDKTGKVQLSENIYAVSNKKYLRIADLTKSENNFSFVSQILNINEFNSKNIDFYCDCDKIIGNVIIRERETGDKIRPAGRNCTKSLKKLFNELSIPIEKRANVGIICDDSGVIGFALNGFYCVDERVKVDNKTKKVITFKFPLED